MGRTMCYSLELPPCCCCHWLLSQVHPWSGQTSKEGQLWTLIWLPAEIVGIATDADHRESGGQLLSVSHVP